jgi:hypothetical protein
MIAIFATIVDQMEDGALNKEKLKLCCECLVAYELSSVFPKRVWALSRRQP